MRSMTENEISYKIRGAIFNVYNNLGPGLLESAYETALKIELEKEGLLVENQVYLPIVYGGVTIPKAYRIDILVLQTTANLSENDRVKTRYSGEL